MAKRVEGRSDKLLECAKSEFMEMGFQEASLRVIAAKADTTTGSIYTRFKDKEGLFHALVDDTIEEVVAWFCESQQEFAEMPADAQDKEAINYGSEKWYQLLDYIYAHWDVFRLLIRCSDIDCYDKMLNRIIDIDVDYTCRFIKCTGKDIISYGKMNGMLLHMLASAYYYGLFEVVQHDMPKEEAVPYVRQLRRFFACGWADLLEAKPE